MEFRMYEYNVTPNITERNEVSILLTNDELTVNGNIIDDENKIIAIKEILEANKEDIIKMAGEVVEIYKGGRQKNLIIKFESDGKMYRIIGNTPSQKIADYYSEIKTEITNIFK